MEVTHQHLDLLRRELHDKLESCVGYSHFYWVIGTMIMVIGSILAFQISLIMSLDNRVEGINEKVSDTAEDVSGLLGEWKQWTRE